MGAEEPRQRTDEEVPVTTEPEPEPGTTPGTPSETKRARVRRLAGGRARWVVAGAAAVVVIGGAAAAAAAHHHEEGGVTHKVTADGRGGARAGFEGPDGRFGPKERDGRTADGERGSHAAGSRAAAGAPAGDGTESSTGEAPAPLPSLSAADAVDKAAAAVKDGKVESLAPVTEQGGGQAWRIVVVGPDGVRHAVTVDGTTGTLTGNTVLNG
ncbi:hypothetical protein WN71_015450 [Streptomyces mangrovisoli]|uniref:PepSY domain-containing protein n=2 Tax=Streptomyces mangrovisoli TaxID=1428628 RepID=A0A1J4NWF6_9ACTN|nr:hypothetical protein WN71_015450 [Streptomyces mangrovisoli]